MPNYPQWPETPNPATPPARKTQHWQERPSTLAGLGALAGFGQEWPRPRACRTRLWLHRGELEMSRPRCAVPDRCTFVTRRLRDNKAFRLKSSTSCVPLSSREPRPRMRVPRGLGGWEKIAVSRPWPGACQVRRTGTGRGRRREARHRSCQRLCCGACRPPLMPLRLSAQPTRSGHRLLGQGRPCLGGSRARTVPQRRRRGQYSRCGQNSRRGQYSRRGQNSRRRLAQIWPRPAQI